MYAHLTDAIFNNTLLVNVNGVLSEMALKSDLTPYAMLDSPALTGTATLNGNKILVQTTALNPAYYSLGQRIELDVATANTAKIDFHSFDTNTSVDYEGRIACTGGVASTVGKGAMTYVAASHTFTGTVKIGTLTVATTDLIPSLVNTPLTGNATLNSLSILAQDTSIILSITVLDDLL